MGKMEKEMTSLKLQDNPFFEFTKKYFYFLRQVKFDFESPDRCITSTWIWSKDKKYHISDKLERELKDLQFCRNNKVGPMQLLNINYSVDEWLALVRQFIVYLDTIELASLYKNDKDESNVYIDCDPLNSSYVLYYYDDNNETEYRISFIETSIPRPGAPSAIATFINATEDEEDSTITLVQIDILRRYGNKRTNQIKLVENSGDGKSLLVKPEEALVFNVFRDILSQVIFNTFNDILNNVNKTIGFERNITEEVLHGYIKLSE